MLQRLTFVNITPVNSDIFISVKPGLFMEESQDVHKFM